MPHTDFASIRAPAGRPIRSWPAFEAALTTVLRVLDDDFLVLQVRGTGRYVQLHVSKGPRIRAEAVSNAYLSGPDRLDAAQLAALERLGWNPPAGGSSAEGPSAKVRSPNFFRELDPSSPVTETASLLVRTLAEVFGAPGPEHLEYRAFDGDDHDVSFPLLGIPEERRPRARARVADRERKLARLRRRVLAAVREITANSSVVFDPQGDLPVGLEDVPGFVRVLANPLVIRAWCILARDVAPTPAVLRRVHDLNAKLKLARLVLVKDVVFLCIDIPAEPFRTEHLVTALCGLRIVAAAMGPRIRKAVEPAVTG